MALFKVKVNGKSEVYIIMKNAIAGLTRPLVYDLKGSTKGRKAKNDKDCKKDLDFTQALGQGTINIRKSLVLLPVVAKDVMFLLEFGVVDYSFLCAVERGGRWDGAIIDIFTKFTPKKFAEFVVIGKMKTDLSCQPPEDYAYRFLGFISRHLTKGPIGC